MSSNLKTQFSTAAKINFLILIFLQLYWHAGGIKATTPIIINHRVLAAPIHAIHATNITLSLTGVAPFCVKATTTTTTASPVDKRVAGKQRRASKLRQWRRNETWTVIKSSHLQAGAQKPTPEKGSFVLQSPQRNEEKHVLEENVHFRNWEVNIQGRGRKGKKGGYVYRC